MSDMGDFWRDVSAGKQARRQYWHECPGCKVRFGTGTKVAPGCRCKHCRWLAPGNRGDDARAVEAAKR